MRFSHLKLLVSSRFQLCLLSAACHAFIVWPRFRRCARCLRTRPPPGCPKP
jgi:hypothetical protein